MSTHTESAPCDGMYSKLIDNESSYFEADVRDPDVQHHSVLVPARREAPRGPAGNRYRTATVCLSALSALLLLAIIAISAHYKNQGGPSVPDSQNQTGQMQRQSADQSGDQSTDQSADPSADQPGLSEALARLQKERDDLLKERDDLLRAAQPVTPGRAPEPPAPTTPATMVTPAATVTPNITCPPRWVLFNTSCYFISSFSLGWAEGQDYCQTTGGHLAIIHTAPEQSFLWDLLPRGHWNAYWFGLSDETAEADWLWVDGTALVGGFWEEGEPNNHIDEDCGYMVKTRKRERVAVRSWYDAPCGMRWPFICEKEMRLQ